jgi:hypothetical protein
MSKNRLSVPDAARVKSKVYTGSETRRLANYASSIGYDLCGNIISNRDDPVKFEEVKLRLFRLHARLLMHTELVLAELPSDNEPVKPMTFEGRELFYWLLGNRSRRVLSLSDEELYEELRNQLRNYR